jgi:excisionase family DNA binding protein
MPETQIEKSFCTTREAATLLGVSVGTVQLWVESGLLQAWKTAGGHRRVLRESVHQLLHKKPEPLPTRPPAPVAPAVQPRRLKVLVVEDDANLLRLYQAHLARWPMAPEVTLTDNAVTALLMMGRQCPDLLITDLCMTGMDGFNMLRVLRETPEIVKTTTIVVVSGLDPDEIKQRGGIPSEIEVLSKPIPFPRLKSIATDLVTQSCFEHLPP